MHKIIIPGLHMKGYFSNKGQRPVEHLRSKEKKDVLMSQLLFT